MAEETVRVSPARMTAVSKLTDHPRNYRSHPDDQLDHLVQSIEEHGFYRNVVCARDHTILAGHGVVAAARRAEIEKVPVVVLDLEPDDPRALKILTGDNELSRIAFSDDRALTELLREIRNQDPVGLLGTGFDDQALAALVFITRPASEIQTHDDALQWLGLPGYEAASTPYKIVVSFDTNEERERWAREHEIQVGGEASPTWSAWWPPRERVNVTALQFDA